MTCAKWHCLPNTLSTWCSSLARYQQAKQRRGLVDFSDLEHYCLQILLEEGSEPGKLIPSALLALELQERFTEVLVDGIRTLMQFRGYLQLVSQQTTEAAETKGGWSDNPIKPLPNLFMVGDVKQSIYRFRLADPVCFWRYHRFQRTGPGAPNQSAGNFAVHPRLWMA